MSENSTALENRLIQMVRSSPTLMDCLSMIRDLELSSWCIGAGAVRSLVWDQLHGFAAPSHYEDVDVAHFDEAAGEEQDDALTRRLLDLRPSIRWEVTNQALIHHWFLNQYSQIVPPLRSLADGIATWPEYATCVGVTLKADESIEIIAPHGLNDLFQLRVRYNPVRASAAAFAQRVAAKRFTERWPLLSVDK
jgi:hypothetical protein